MKFNKKAFTLTELIIALGVIGILAAVLMPIIANMLPDTNAIMAKRAYYAVQNVVSDMINNGDCYPDTSRASSTDLRRLGLEDGYRYPNCVGWETNASVEYWDSDAKDAVTGETKHLKGDPKEGYASTKFATLFKAALDVKEENGNVFTTKDGIQWEFSDLDEFDDTKNSAAACVVMNVDVNNSKRPNRRDTGSESATIFNRTVKRVAYDDDNPLIYDVFAVEVCADGKVNVIDNWAQKVIDIDYNVQGGD